MVTRIKDLKQFADSKNIRLTPQKEIAEEASRNIAEKYNYSHKQIKENFDMLLRETEEEAYRIYLSLEKQYGQRVIEEFIKHLVDSGEINSINNASEAISNYFNVFERFFLSLVQSRKPRAGRTFEYIHNSLFKILDYKFDEQKIINGKPDFLMPGLEHWEKNPMDCIIFTSKRTLRERWRQIVTEGTRGIGFFLATIDKQVSAAQLEEMHKNRIYLVTPESIKEEFYPEAVNVLSFSRFFRDYLDPAMERWRRNNVIK